MVWLWLYGFALIHTVNIIECKKNRVCYADSPSCKHHDLYCGQGRIAVYTAKYGYVNRTEYHNCHCGDADCDSCRNHTKQPKVRQCFLSYNDTDYWNIVSNCSFKQRCSVSLPSRINNTCSWVSKSMLSPSFSRISYGCLNNSTVGQFCSAHLSKKTSLSILYEKRTAVNVHCLCNVAVSGHETDISKYEIKSLDIRNSSIVGGGFFNLSFWSNGTAKNIVNQTISQNERIFEVLENQKTQIRLSFLNHSNSPRRIWVQIKAKGGRSVSASCQPEEDWAKTTASETTQTTLTTDGFTPSHVRSTTPDSSDSPQTDDSTLSRASETTQTTLTTDGFATSHVRSTTADSSGGAESTPEPADDTTINQAGFKVAPITGGVAGGVSLVAVITVVLVVCYRQRNKSNHGSKKNHTNPLFVDESCYSLAADMQRNTEDRNSGDLTSRNDEASEAHYIEVDTQDKGTIKINHAPSTNNCYDHVSMVVSKAPPFQATSDMSDRATEDIDSDYDRLGTDKKQPGRLNAEYDTTVSASKAVKELENQENYYSYDHLGMSKGKAAADSDYDTTSRFTK